VPSRVSPTSTGERDVTVSDETFNLTFERLEVLPDDPPFDAGVLERLAVRGLHVGCGPRLHPGWLNTDTLTLEDERGGATEPGRLARVNGELPYLQHDATARFPLPDRSFDWAHSSHLIEHLPFAGVIELLRELERLVRPGGVVRVSTPDLELYMEGYLDPDEAFFAEHRARLARYGFQEGRGPERRAWMVNQVFKKWGHQWVYDFDELRHVAELAGFAPAAVTRWSCGSGSVAEVAALDFAFREDETLYVEIAVS
jgi:predicted SAM-dependent methyltransferase